MTVQRKLELVRDGTLMLPGRSEVDLRTPDYEVWITVKGERDDDVERVVADLLNAFGECNV
jgi:hypothetical protein